MNCAQSIVVIWNKIKCATFMQCAINADGVGGGSHAGQHHHAIKNKIGLMYVFKCCTIAK